MEEMIFVEILDKRGNVAQRVRCDRAPVTIGRSYSSDVIIDDPYVSPQHAVVRRGEDGGLVLEDAESENGLYELQPLRRISSSPAGGNRQFRLGQTVVRIRDPRYPVPPALSQQAAPRRGILDSRLACVEVCTLVAGLFALDSYLSSFEKLNAGPILTKLAGLAVMLIVWSGAWSLAARVISQRFRFAQYCAIAALWLAIASVFEHVLDYYAFAFAAGLSETVLAWAGAFLLIAAAIYSHLRFSSPSPPRRLMRGSLVTAGIVVGLAGVLAVGAHSNSSMYAWTIEPQYPAQLKLPILRIAPSKDVAGFFSEMKDLKARVDAASRDD